MPEDVYGAVITALNEEAVAAAALANKGGINLIATYEAFGAKMHGVMRQEIVFTKQQKALGQEYHWLSVPLVLTSHTWENGKNEQSHQDPVMAETLLNEPSDISRVLFPPDYNATAVLMQRLYQTHTRPEPLMGTLYPLVKDREQATALGFINQGGMLEHRGMLFINRSTWGHVLLETARILGKARSDVLDVHEQEALAGQRNPEGIII